MNATTVRITSMECMNVRCPNRVVIRGNRETNKYHCSIAANCSAKDSCVKMVSGNAVLMISKIV